MRALLVCAALVVLLPVSTPAAEKSSDLDRQPAGIVPTTATLQTVLKLHATAVGARQPGMLDTARERWTFDQAGFAGTETLVRSGLDYHSVRDRGPLHDEFGKLAGSGWHLDGNGVVSPLQHEEFESFAMQRVLEAASDPKNDVKLLGETSSPAAYVLEVREPLEKHPKWFFYDKATGNVVRTEQIIDDERVTSVYGDYRVTKGLSSPWHVHDVEEKSGVEFDFVRQSLIVGDPVDPTEFKAPEGRFRPGAVASHVIAPSSIKFASVVVRLTVAGRGLDFEICSGCSGSFIDRQVALELGLPTYDQVLKAKNGDLLGFDTEIPEAMVGDMPLTNFVLRAVDFHYQPTYDTKIVGLLGSDFLRSGVYMIDYIKREVEAEPAIDDAMVVAIKSGDAFELPVTFDDGTPFVKVTIDGHETGDVVLDNSFVFSTVLGPFASKFPQSVPDESGHAHRKTVLPFADSKQYGKDMDVWISDVPSFNVDQLSLLKYPVVATDGDLSDEHTIDAVMGMSFLENFDVVLDFANRRVILRKNDIFKHSFERKP